MLLHKLKYFIEVTRQKSFTRAAESLYVSQPALSKQMKQLEEELGFLVFNRSVRGVELTEKGRALYTDLLPLFTKIDQTIHQYLHHDKIRFGSTPFLSSYFLHNYYDKLQYTNFHVTVIKDDSKDLLPLLQAREIDAAIIQGVPSSPQLYSTLLFQDDFLAAVPVSSPLAAYEEITLEQCMSETQIIPPAGPLAKQIQEYRRNRNFKGNILETHYHAMAGFVSLGIGVAYLPEIMVKQIEFKGVVFLPIKDKPLTRNMYLYAVTPSMLEFLLGKFHNNDS
ncbi:LysR family transcriptional regulator [Halobacillus salinarum]|uniref:LysR family transcriptional regulator n=1 Tax=Halobacillus salinarum TaxID=2932257 RepID=A0ABY4EIF0_9BACI|nr:LysR family transcriptional regulator [Halobacillus salinarum]UOQ44205.1 LysR family transcriptional regulator [Halobacillus salinarum]